MDNKQSPLERLLYLIGGIQPARLSYDDSQECLSLIQQIESALEKPEMKKLAKCSQCAIYDHRKGCNCDCHKNPNTVLLCSICDEDLGIVCMMSPDSSAVESFKNQTRHHFETKHQMKKQIPTISIEADVFYKIQQNQRTDTDIQNAKIVDEIRKIVQKESKWLEGLDDTYKPYFDYRTIIEKLQQLLEVKK